MFMSVLVTAVAIPSLVISAELVCHQVETCTNSAVSCECREALFRLIWRVNNLTLHEMPYRPSDIGEVRVGDGYTSVLYDVTASNDITRLASLLNFTLTNHLQVGCEDNVGFNVTTLQRSTPGFPSSPVNLNSTLTPDCVDVRLNWDPPLNDGGVAISNYLIFVNMSQQVVSNTTTTLTLNSARQHFIEISAVNECGLVGANASSFIEGFDCPFMTAGSNQLQIIASLGSGVGLLLVVAVCIVVSTVLVKKRKRTRKCVHPKSSQQEPVVPRSGEQLSRVVISEYSLLDTLNGAEPELIPKQDDFGAGAESQKQAENNSPMNIMYAEVETGRQKTFIAARNDIQYAEVQASAKSATEDAEEPKYDIIASSEVKQTAGYEQVSNCSHAEF